uniref:Uncharacterized protein n=1 Tax=Clytia hemisphaerica TaxID=252671 RepID=A0A7M5UZK7_9CNID
MTFIQDGGFLQLESHLYEENNETPVTKFFINTMSVMIGRQNHQMKCSMKNLDEMAVVINDEIKRWILLVIVLISMVNISEGKSVNEITESSISDKSFPSQKIIESLNNIHEEDTQWTLDQSINHRPDVQEIHKVKENNGPEIKNGRIAVKNLRPHIKPKPVPCLYKVIYNTKRVCFWHKCVNVVISRLVYFCSPQS